MTFKQSPSFKFVFLFVVFLSLCCEGKAQIAYSKEAGFVTENDLYVSFYRDRYYTNGIFFFYRYLDKKKTRLSKKIHEFELVQKIYNPNKASSPSIWSQDRPYAGYLYGSYGITRFYKSNASFRTTLELGVIGPSSLAEETQGAIHEIYGFKKSEGWEYQIQNTFAANITLEYTKALISKNASKIDIHSQSTLKAGTVFSQLSSNIVVRYNLLRKLFNPLSNSVLFKSNLNSDEITDTKECFFYMKPQVHFNIHDATIQGSLFTFNSPKTFEVIPITYEIEYGISHSSRRFNFQYSIILYSRKLNEMIEKTNTYGSIKIGYKFN